MWRGVRADSVVPAVAYARASSTSVAVPLALSFAPALRPLLSLWATTTIVSSSVPSTTAARLRSSTSPTPGTSRAPAILLALRGRRARACRGTSRLPGRRRASPARGWRSRARARRSGRSRWRRRTPAGAPARRAGRVGRSSARRAAAGRARPPRASGRGGCSAGARPSRASAAARPWSRHDHEVRGGLAPSRGL